MRILDRDKYLQAAPVLADRFPGFMNSSRKRFQKAIMQFIEGKLRIPGLESKHPRIRNQGFHFNRILPSFHPEINILFFVLLKDTYNILEKWCRPRVNGNNLVSLLKAAF